MEIHPSIGEQFRLRVVVGAGLEIMEPVLWVFVILTGFTVLQRIRKTWQQLDT